MRRYATVGDETSASHASAPDISAIPTTSSGRVPTRSDSRPAMGATRIGMAVHGSVRRPACSGEYPCTVWKNCASRKMEPNIPKYISSDTRLAAVNSRLAKNSIGIIGSPPRRLVSSSHATNDATSSPPTISGPATPSDVQPCSFPRTSPNTMPNNPALTSARPGRSNERLGPYVSVSRAHASGTMTMPMGTFSQKIHCHDRPSTTAPPTRGPSATASPATPPQMPSIAPRRSGGTAADRIVSVSGVTMALPTPCIARNAISAPDVGASAAAAEPAVKIAMPMTNIRLRPKRSPSAAPVSSRTANVSVYAFTIHSSDARDAPRLRLITGSAVVTTRLSSDTMKIATEAMARVQSIFARSVMSFSLLPAGSRSRLFSVRPRSR